MNDVELKIYEDCFKYSRCITVPVPKQQLTAAFDKHNKMNNVGTFSIIKFIAPKIK